MGRNSDTLTEPARNFFEAREKSSQKGQDGEYVGDETVKLEGDKVRAQCRTGSVNAKNQEDGEERNEEAHDR